MRTISKFLWCMYMFTVCQAVDSRLFSEYTTIPKICVGKFVRGSNLTENFVSGSLALYEEFDVLKGVAVNSSLSWEWYSGLDYDVKGFDLTDTKNRQSAIGLAGLCQKAAISIGYVFSNCYNKDVISALYFGLGGMYFKEQCCSEFFPEYRYSESSKYLNASYILEGEKEELNLALDFKAFYVSKNACIVFSVFAKIFDLKVFDGENYKFISFNKTKSVFEYSKNALTEAVQKYVVSKGILSCVGRGEDTLINSSISMSYKSGSRSRIGMMFIIKYISRDLQQARFWSDFDNINAAYIGNSSIVSVDRKVSDSIFNYVQLSACLMYQMII